MTKFALSLMLLALCCLPASASIIWGSASLSDNNGGAFLSGFSIATSPTAWTLSLRNFEQDSFATPSPGELTLGVSVKSTDPTVTIIGVIYKYFGSIDTTGGPATISYIQTASGAPGSPASGSLAALPFSGQLLTSSETQMDLTTILDLHDNGGLARIDRIEFDPVTAPEPSTWLLTLLAATGWAVFRRAKSL
jgi:hypothetical protein